MIACKMPGFRFHDLRHTFRTQGAEAGVPLEVMMAQLGHMDRQTSLEYVHIQQRALQRAQELIEREQAEILSVARGRQKSASSGDRLLTGDSQHRGMAARVGHKRLNPTVERQGDRSRRDLQSPSI